MGARGSHDWGRLLMGTALSAMILASEPAFAQDNAPQPEQGVPVEDAGKDEIIVTGIRASIQAAIDAKRSADSVVEVVAAEDIGKFANENVAEALQRVPGVQIDREGGEGRFVSIRGLGPSFNRTTINGRTAVSIGSNGTTNNRAFNFDSLATEFISRITVYKTPTADLDEGGLGGIIDIRTAKPLDRRIGRGRGATSGDVTALSAEMSYGDLAEKFEPRFSVLASRRFTDDFGVLISAAWNRRSLRTDLADAPSQSRVTVGAQTPFRPGNLRQALVLEERDRVGISVSTQWQPADWRLSVDYLYSYFDQDLTRDQLQYPTPAATVVAASQVVNAAGTRVDRFSANNATLASFNQVSFNRTDTHIVGGNIARDFGPWTVSTDLSYATVLYRARLDSASAGFRRNLMIDLTGDVPFITTNTPITSLLPSEFTTFLAQTNLTRTKETEKAGQFDILRHLDSPVFESFSFGGKYRTRETDVVFNVYQFTNAQLLAASAALGISLVPPSRPFPVDNFLGDYPVGNRQFFAIDTPAYLANISSALDRILPGGPTTDVPDTSRSFGVQEEVTSGYAKINLKGEIGDIGFRGNVGVRIAKTNSLGEGFVFDPVSRMFKPSAGRNSYTDVLPSVNLALDLTRNLVLRLGAAKVITRPDLVDLSPTVVVQNLGLGTARSGDPNLAPFRATQYDAILEWYPFNNRASFVVGAFYKDIASFTETVTSLEAVEGFTAAVNSGLFEVTRPTNNGDGATVKGIEFAVQMPFEMFTRALDGFGLNANLTLIDSKTSGVDKITGIRLGVTGVADTNYNIVAYFEKWGFGARASYTFRDSFLSVRNNAISGGAEFTDPYATLDANLSYDILKNISVSFQAVNILKENTRTYSGFPELLRAITFTDRRFIAGIRARF